MKEQSRIFWFVREFFKFFDIFHIQLTVFYNGNLRTPTRLGSVFTLLIFTFLIIICPILFISIFQFYKNENLNYSIIPPQISINSAQSKSLPFIFAFQFYRLENNKLTKFDIDQTYLNFTVMQVSNYPSFIKRPINFESCTFKGNISSNYCINNDFILAGKANLSNFFSYLEISLSKCLNTRSKGIINKTNIVNCKANEEISNYLKNSKMRILYNESLLDVIESNHLIENLKSNEWDLSNEFSISIFNQISVKNLIYSTSSNSIFSLISQTSYLNFENFRTEISVETENINIIKMIIFPSQNSSNTLIHKTSFLVIFSYLGGMYFVCYIIMRFIIKNFKRFELIQNTMNKIYSIVSPINEEKIIEFENYIAKRYNESIVKKYRNILDPQEESIDLDDENPRLAVPRRNSRFNINDQVPNNVRKISQSIIESNLKYRNLIKHSDHFPKIEKFESPDKSEKNIELIKIKDNNEKEIINENSINHTGRVRPTQKLTDNHYVRTGTRRKTRQKRYRTFSNNILSQIKLMSSNKIQNEVYVKENNDVNEIDEENKNEKMITPFEENDFNNTKNLDYSPRRNMKRQAIVQSPQKNIRLKISFDEKFCEQTDILKKMILSSEIEKIYSVNHYKRKSKLKELIANLNIRSLEDIEQIEVSTERKSILKNKEKFSSSKSNQNIIKWIDFRKVNYFHEILEKNNNNIDFLRLYRMKLEYDFTKIIINKGFYLTTIEIFWMYFYQCLPKKSNKKKRITIPIHEKNFEIFKAEEICFEELTNIKKILHCFFQYDNFQEIVLNKQQKKIFSLQKILPENEELNDLVHFSEFQKKVQKILSFSEKIKFILKENMSFNNKRLLLLLGLSYDELVKLEFWLKSKYQKENLNDMNEQMANSKSTIFNYNGLYNEAMKKFYDGFQNKEITKMTIKF